MKNWLFRRILNRHRLLFRFWDGSRFVHEDPFLLLRRLVSTSEIDVDTDLKLLDVPDVKLVSKKIGQIAAAVRGMFGIKPLEDGGLTELECVNLLIQFIEYLERVKKNGGIRQTSDTSSASQTKNQGTGGSVDQKDMSGHSAST